MDNLAEQGIIGALLMDSSAVGMVNELSPEMFTDSLYGKVFYEYRKAYATGEEITGLNIREKLQSEYPERDIMDILKKCVENTATSMQIRPYSKIVFNGYRSKQLGNIINRIEPIPDRIDEQIGELINSLEALKRNEKAKLRRLDSIVDEHSPNYFKDREEQIMNIGFPKIDDATGGLEGGDVILIGARPAVGKSAFVSQLAVNVADSGKKVAIYNLEMPEKQEYERFLSSSSGLKLNRIRRAKSFLGDEESRFKTANAKLKGLDLYLRSGIVKASDIKQEIKNIGFDLVIIDYIQLLQPERFYGNRAAEVGAISAAVKDIAMSFNIPVIALSQLNRVSEMNASKEPTMADLRESGNLEQDASIICLMWNCDDEDLTQKGFKVAKNRQGNTIRIPMVFNGSEMRFEESDGFVKVKKSGVKDETPFD